MTVSIDHATPWVPELTFAARLALIRNRLGWNQKEAALACGLPQQSWRNWELGKRPQDYEQICRRIADRTGCSLRWLAFGGDVNPGSLPFHTAFTSAEAA